MYLNHPNVALRALEFRRCELLAEVVEARRAAEARPTRTGRPPLAATLRQRLGSAWVALGRRIQRGQPVGRVGSSAAETGARS